MRIIYCLDIFLVPRVYISLKKYLAIFIKIGRNNPIDCASLVNFALLFVNIYAYIFVLTSFVYNLPYLHFPFKHKKYRFIPILI